MSLSISAGARVFAVVMVVTRVSILLPGVVEKTIASSLENSQSLSQEGSLFVFSVLASSRMSNIMAMKLFVEGLESSASTFFITSSVGTDAFVDVLNDMIDGVEVSDTDTTMESVVVLSMPPIRFLTLLMTSSKRESSPTSTGYLGVEATSGPEIHEIRYK